MLVSSSGGGEGGGVFAISKSDPSSSLPLLFFFFAIILKAEIIVFDGLFFPGVVFDFTFGLFGLLGFVGVIISEVRVVSASVVFMLDSRDLLASSPSPPLWTMAVVEPPSLGSVIPKKKL